MMMYTSISGISSRQRRFCFTTIVRSFLQVQQQQLQQHRMSRCIRFCSCRGKTTYPLWTGNFQVAANIPWMASASPTATNTTTIPLTSSFMTITSTNSATDPHLTCRDGFIVDGMKEKITKKDNEFDVVVDMKRLLPRTWKDALRMQKSKHAMVITTFHESHTIVHVNDAWMELCGYTLDESVSRTFNELIHGPDTNQKYISRVARKVLDTNTCQDAYLVNYTKEGRRFYNHLSIGPLYLENSTVDMMKHIVENEEISQLFTNTKSHQQKQQQQQQQRPSFMVGILREVKREQIPLRCIA